jgi:hypothetical protein
MQDAGAAAIELNIYYLPGDPHIAGRVVEQHNYSIGGDASCTIRRTRTRSDATPRRMTTHALTLVLSTIGVGFLMVKAGPGKNAREPRRRRRICPSGGREITGRRCNAH